MIKAGAATEVELKERKHRIEDAVRNAKAAVEEGIVAGGGVALLQSAPALDELKLDGDEATGANIVRVALSAPLKQIAFNAGLEPGVVAEKVSNLPAGHGLNAATGEYEDLLKAGVADPVKVTRSALQNAASIAALFLTTEAVVADKPEKAPHLRATRPVAWVAWTSKFRKVLHFTKGPARLRAGPFRARASRRVCRWRRFPPIFVVRFPVAVRAVCSRRHSRSPRPRRPGSLGDAAPRGWA